MAIHSNNPVRHPGWQTSPFTADKKIQDQWHHLAVAYSSKKGTVQVYFDGKLDAEGKWGPHPGALTQAPSAPDASVLGAAAVVNGKAYLTK